MKNAINFFSGLILLFTSVFGYAQELRNPVIENYGGVFELPYEVLKPDPNLKFKIVIDVYSGADKASELNTALLNVARMLNLHSVGGVPPENMDVVLAIHAEAAYSVMNNAEYRKKYGVDNPNLGLITELKSAGLKLYICGQSLVVRKIDKDKLAPEVEIALSMLTTVTTHQLMGYAFMKF